MNDDNKAKLIGEAGQGDAKPITHEEAIEFLRRLAIQDAPSWDMAVLTFHNKNGLCGHLQIRRETAS